MHFDGCRTSNDMMVSPKQRVSPLQVSLPDLLVSFHTQSSKWLKQVALIPVVPIYEGPTGRLPQASERVAWRSRTWTRRQRLVRPLIAPWQQTRCRPQHQLPSRLRHQTKQRRWRSARSPRRRRPLPARPARRCPQNCPRRRRLRPAVMARGRMPQAGRTTVGRCRRQRAARRMNQRRPADRSRRRGGRAGRKLQQMGCMHK